MVTRCFLSKKEISGMMTSPILLTVACMRLLRLCVTTGKRVATGRMVVGRYVPRPRSEKNNVQHGWDRSEVYVWAMNLKSSCFKLQSQPISLLVSSPDSFLEVLSDSKRA